MSVFVGFELDLSPEVQIFERGDINRTFSTITDTENSTLPGVSPEVSGTTMLELPEYL